jgi:hypothetical protein
MKTLKPKRQRLTLRLPEATIEAFDKLAACESTTRNKAVVRYLEAAVLGEQARRNAIQKHLNISPDLAIQILRLQTVAKKTGRDSTNILAQLTDWLEAKAA